MSFEFETLNVYHESKRFCSEIYLRTRLFPDSELYGLTSQLRRAAVSVVANLAEGCGRRTRVEQRRFYNIGHASLYECVALLGIAVDLLLLTEDDYKPIRNKAESISAMLNGLIKYTKKI